jgi:hypothetical protein
MPFLGTTGGGSVRQYGGLANLGYFLRNSLRFRASNNAKLTRTPGSASNRKTYTISAWVKFGESDSAIRTIFCAGDSSSSTSTHLYIYASQIRFYFGGAGGPEWRATQLLRDPAAWYHIVAAVDTNQGTLDDKLKLYVNGTRVTSWVSQNSIGVIDTQINNTLAHALGSNAAANQYLYDGYMTEFNFIDGQQLTPSSFAKTDAVTGQWIPIKFGGAYGTNGFYLNFNDNSAATAAAIGKDSSGNGNNYTPSGISVTTGTTYDAMIDSPTLSGAASNYCTLSPLALSNGALSDGNLTWSPTGNNGSVWSTFAVNTGKWYFEMAKGTSGDAFMSISQTPKFNGFQTDSDTVSVSLYMYYTQGSASENRFIYNSTATAFPTGFGNDDNGTVYGVTLDFDAKEITVYRNNDGTTKATFTMPAALYAAPLFVGYSVTTTWPSGQFYWNFGQRPFAYTPPTGFKSLNTFNLP